MLRYPLFLALIIIFAVSAYAESIDELEQVITQNPGDIAARKQLALNYYEAGDLNRAIIQLESLVQLAPRDVEVAQSLIAAYRMVSLKLQAQKEYDEALSYADKSIDLGKKHELDIAPGQYQRVIVLSEQGNMDQALKELSDLPPDSQLAIDAEDLVVAALLRQAKNSIKQKDYHKALDQIARASQIDPQKYSYLHLQTVHILAYIGETEKALEVLDPLVSVLPLDDDLFQYRIGSLYKKLGETNKAAEYLAKVPEGSPYYERAQSILETASQLTAMMDELRGALGEGDIDLAVIKLRDMVKLDPTEHRMRLILAKLLIRQADQQGALAELEALNLSRSVVADPYYQFEMGKLYNTLGQHERSEKLLKQISEDSDHYSEAQKLLEEMIPPVKPDAEIIKKPDEVLVEKPDVKPEIKQDVKPDEKPDIEVVEKPLVEPVQPPIIIKPEDKQEMPEEKPDTPIKPEEKKPEEKIKDKPPIEVEQTMPEVKITIPEVEIKPVQEQTTPPVQPDVEPVQNLVVEPAEPPKPSLANAQALAEDGFGDKALEELSRLVADPETKRGDKDEYEIGILYMQLGKEDSAKEHLEIVSEESMFHRAAQAFLVQPVVEEPPMVEQTEDEEAQLSIPLHPIEQRIRDIVANHRIEPSLALALMRQESSFRIHAVSGVGAAGLCQIMPPTGRDLGLKIPRYGKSDKPKVNPEADERFDPYKCMDAGFKYLRQLLNRYDGNVPLALSAYNAGMGRTKSRVARIYETTSYVSDVMTHYWRYQDKAEMDAAMAKLVGNIEAEG